MKDILELIVLTLVGGALFSAALVLLIDIVRETNK